MIDIFWMIFFTWALVFGVRISTNEGMVFEKIGEYAKDQLKEGRKIWEALVLCPYCLSSIWSVPAIGLYFLINTETNLKLLFAYPVIVGFTSLLSGMTWSFFEVLWAKKSYYEKAEEKAHLEVKTMKETYHHNKNKQNGSNEKSTR